jgi:hypothetical protein
VEVAAVEVAGAEEVVVAAGAEEVAVVVVGAVEVVDAGVVVLEDEHPTMIVLAITAITRITRMNLFINVYSLSVNFC